MHTAVHIWKRLFQHNFLASSQPFWKSPTTSCSDRRERERAAWRLWQGADARWELERRCATAPAQPVPRSCQFSSDPIVVHQPAAPRRAEMTGKSPGPRRAPQPPREPLTSALQQQSLPVVLKRERKRMTKSWRNRLGELLQLKEPKFMFPIWAVNECPGIWLGSMNS